MRVDGVAIVRDAWKVTSERSRPGNDSEERPGFQIRKLDDQAIFKSWIRPSAFLKFEREIESSILNPPRDERRPSEPVRCC